MPESGRQQRDMMELFQKALGNDVKSKRCAQINVCMDYSGRGGGGGEAPIF